MNKIKSIMFGLVLGFIVAVCPILSGCFKTPDNTAKVNYSKAMDAAVQEIKSIGRTEGLSLCALQYGDASEEIDADKYMILDYMNESVESEGFDLPGKAFEATLLTIPGGSIYGIHDYNVDGNNVVAKIAYSYRQGQTDVGFAGVDYEKIDINYDFANDTLVSFVWTSYIVNGNDGYLFQLVFEDGESKILVEDASTDYIVLKAQVRDDAEELFNSQDKASTVYNFTAAYRNVYYAYNGYYPEEA